MPNSQGSFSIEEIKLSFEKFEKENGYYPTALEIDKCDYLPSSRQIQRHFGGLVDLRTKLGLSGSTNFTAGEYRSKVSSEGDLRAKKYEAEFYDFLISNIDEVKVHEHKIIRPGGVASDFFIYTTAHAGFFIDLFYAKDIHSLAGIVTIKANKPLPKNMPVYFILVGNEAISQDVIDKIIKNRKNILESNIRVITEDYFKSNFNEIVKDSSHE